MRLTTSGREMAGLVRGGRGGLSVKMGFMLPILRLIDKFNCVWFVLWFPVAVALAVNAIDATSQNATNTSS